MDKFTKTTEVDISNMNIMEEEAPQKRKAGKIIAMIICLLLAVVAWIYVVETDDTKVEKTFDDITVVLTNGSDKQFTAENVSVTLIGTNSQLVDVDKSKIIFKIDAASYYNGVNKFSAYSDVISYDGEEEVEIKDKLVKIYISLKESGK